MPFCLGEDDSTVVVEGRLLLAYAFPPFLLPTLFLPYPFPADLLLVRKRERGEKATVRVQSHRLGQSAHPSPPPPLQRPKRSTHHHYCYTRWGAPLLAPVATPRHHPSVLSSWQKKKERVTDTLHISCHSAIIFPSPPPQNDPGRCRSASIGLPSSGPRPTRARSSTGR